MEEVFDEISLAEAGSDRRLWIDAPRLSRSAMVLSLF